MAKAKGGAEKKEKLTFSQKVKGCLKWTWSGLRKMDLSKYFFLSCTLYLTCGLLIQIFSASVNKYFCDINPDIYGCANCENKLMLCPKPQCWRDAANATYLLYADESSKDLYESFAQAALDVVANEFITQESIENPLQLIEKFQSNTDTEVNAASIQFHCKVLFVAVGYNARNNVSGWEPSGCGYKNSAGNCVCNDLRFDDLTAREFNNLETTCRRLAPVDLAGFAKQRKEGICALDSVPSWCPNTTADETSSAEPTPAPTAAPTPAPTPEPTGAPTSPGRRLQPGSAAEHGSAPRVLQDLPGYRRETSQDDSRESSQDDGSGAAADLPISDWGCAEEYPDVNCMRRMTSPSPAGGSAPSSPSPGGSSGSGTGSGSGSSSSASDGNEIDWQVTDWSRCTCMQQCVAGVMTRSVSCPAGDDSQCASTKPPTSQACGCVHCANCIGQELILQFNAIAYWVQGGLSLLLFLAFWSISYLEEDDLVDTGCCTKMVGAIAKSTPLLVRATSYLTLAPQLFNILSVLIPTGDFQAACKHNPDLKFLTILIFSVWVFQIVLGIAVKNARPMPPWLFNAQKKGLMTTLCTPCRAIGP